MQNHQTIPEEFEKVSLEKIVEDPTFICSLENPTINERMLAEDIVRKSSADERMTLLKKDRALSSS
ncbi:MAG TPA: hypothetical protein VG537_09880 [Candidatus Kapabacteria bacterium]|nr:hypothetical protein [Candidatus Kapabacteria bacterium]